MITVFAEGVTDQVLLTRLLSDLRTEGGVRIVASGGSDAARPLARKQLLVSRDPVALVIDSDTTDPAKVTQQQRELEDYLRWGAQGTPFIVVQFVPQIEIIFFQHPAVLRRLLRTEVDEHAIFAGKFAPKAFVEGLLASSGSEGLSGILGRLTDQDVAELRENDTVKRLRTFVRESGSMAEHRAIRSA